MALEESVISTVTNSNFKNLGEFPTIHFQDTLNDSRVISKQMNENLVRGSARLNGGLDSLLLRAGKDIAEPDIAESVAQSKMASSDLPTVMAQLGSVVAALQQIVKTAQTTPPITHGM